MKQKQYHFHNLKKKHKLFLKHIVSSECQILKNNVGTFCLYSIENGALSLSHLELIRRHIQLKTKKYSKIWFISLPNHSVTKKSLGIRMGSGKGAHDHFIFKVRTGDKLLSCDNVSLFQILKIVKTVQSILPFKVKFLYNNF